MEGFQKLSFGYDYMGRRVRKTVYTYKGTSETWVQTGDVKYVWAGWLLLLELDGTDSDAVLRKYTWGLDVAGQNGQLNSLESAGGIGGLLAVYDTNGTTTGQNPTEDDKTYVYLYDANGNVGQLVDWTDIPDWESKQLTSAQDWHADRLVARYEYDPYGNVVGPDTDSDGDWTDDAGPYATVNPFRFSTKQWDDETGLGYWGYRYYSPSLGRWISRDPIEEEAGPHLYTIVSNNIVNSVGSHGRRDDASDTRMSTAIRVKGTFDVTWGGLDQGDPGVGSTLFVRYTLTDGEAQCCESPKFVQMAATKLITGHFPYYAEWSPPHPDAEKGEEVDEGEESWPFYRYQRKIGSGFTHPGERTMVTLDDKPNWSGRNPQVFWQKFEACVVCDPEGQASSSCQGRILGCTVFRHEYDSQKKKMVRTGDGPGKRPLAPSLDFYTMMAIAGLDYTYRSCGCPPYDGQPYEAIPKPPLNSSMVLSR